MIVFSLSKAEPLVDTDNNVCLWNFYFNAENDGVYATTSIGVNMKNGNLKPIEEWTKKKSIVSQNKSTKCRIYKAS